MEVLTLTWTGLGSHREIIINITENTLCPILTKNPGICNRPEIQKIH